MNAPEDEKRSEPEDFEEVVDTLDKAGEGRRKVTIGAILDAFGSRAYAPLLLVPALLAASPVGVIPGMSVSMAAILLLVGGQVAWGRPTPWVPAALKRLSFRSRLLHKTTDKARPAARAVDRVIDERLERLTGPTTVRVAGAASMLLAVTIFPLALVPFGVLAPSVAIILIALALAARDGLLMLVSLTLAAVALAASVWLVAVSGIVGLAF